MISAAGTMSVLDKESFMFKIACPKCDFRPTPNILWQCHPGCGYKWHTFATHGVCPGCSKMWIDTKCPHCKLWSPIDDWYREDLPEREASREIMSHKGRVSVREVESAAGGTLAL